MAPVTITINNTIIKSKTSINVLGVQFDSKLTWAEHVNKTINKSKRALHAIRLIKKHFTKQELLNLLTSNFYSILYYNSEIWHLTTLKQELKKKLLSASANALKICSTWKEENVSFEKLHQINKRATPIKMSMYKLAIQLFKLYNSEKQTPDWIDLNLQQNFNGRSTKFLVSNCAKYKIGSNLLVNRLSALNNIVELSWLNLSLNSFKIKCKSLLLT